MLTLALAITACVATAGAPQPPLPTQAELFEVLPTEVAGHTLVESIVVDDEYRLGHPVDDVLKALGTSRSDARIVFRGSQETGRLVGAIVAQDRRADEVLTALSQNWAPNDIATRAQRLVAGKNAWILGARSGIVVAAYIVSNVVYVVSAPELTIVESVVPLVPSVTTERSQ